jgi:hypothetical protein
LVTRVVVVAALAWAVRIVRVGVVPEWRNKGRDKGIGVLRERHGRQETERKNEGKEHGDALHDEYSLDVDD